MIKRHCEKMMAVKYSDKRDVHMISSIDKFGMKNVKKRGSNTKVSKPLVIVNYNENMGAVDQTDPTTQYNSISPKKY